MRAPRFVFARLPALPPVRSCPGLRPVLRFRHRFVWRALGMVAARQALAPVIPPSPSVSVPFWRPLGTILASVILAWILLRLIGR